MPENLNPSRPSWWWLVALSAALALVMSVTGCGSATVQEMLPDQTLAYKKSREASENLELPPNLRAGSFDDALDVPSLDGGGATYSDYASGRAKRSETASSGEVLPAVANVEMRRSGSERWLEVQGSPQQVWPRVIAFWRQQGVLLAEQDPAVGVMKTDWLDNRAEIPQDFITRQLRKVVDGLYATSTRDQFRVQVEAGPRAGTTEVRLTHKGMEEKLVTNTLGDSQRTVWEPSGTDPGKEAEMLRRLMLFLGASEQQAKQALAGAPKGSGGASAAAASPASPARVVTEGGSQVLIIGDEYRRGWRMVGSALDRAGFSVEDRDMTRGAYYVRYQDADAGAKKRSLGSRLAFWRKDDIDRVKQYQIRVEGGETQTRVTVLDANGNPDGSASAGRILTLLAEQMN
ncbi:MAG: outer membrane protein assembly factor BamC [Bdellovibrio bacteriovorus]